MKDEKPKTLTTSGTVTETKFPVRVLPFEICGPNGEKLTPVDPSAVLSLPPSRRVRFKIPGVCKFDRGTVTVTLDDGTVIVEKWD